MSQQQQNLPTVLQQTGSEADDKPFSFSIRYHFQHALKLMLL